MSLINMGRRLSQNAYFSRRVAKSMCLININGIMMVSTHQKTVIFGECWRTVSVY